MELFILIYFVISHPSQNMAFNSLDSFQLQMEQKKEMIYTYFFYKKPLIRTSFSDRQKVKKLQ